MGEHYGVAVLPARPSGMTKRSLATSTGSGIEVYRRCFATD